MRFSVYGLLRLKGMICSAIDPIDWNQNVDFLVNLVGSGKEVARRGVGQFEVDGQKVGEYSIFCVTEFTGNFTTGVA
jgi:hypothetical protein